MAEPFIAGLPPELPLAAGYRVRLQALDPLTGLAVTGVSVSNVAIFVRNVGGSSASALTSGPFMLVAGPEG